MKKLISHYKIILFLSNIVSMCFFLFIFLFFISSNRMEWLNQIHNKDGFNYREFENFKEVNGKQKTTWRHNKMEGECWKIWVNVFFFFWRRRSKERNCFKNQDHVFWTTPPLDLLKLLTFLLFGKERKKKH